MLCKSDRESVCRGECVLVEVLLGDHSLVLVLELDESNVGARRHGTNFLEAVEPIKQKIQRRKEEQKVDREPVGR